MAAEVAEVAAAGVAEEAEAAEEAARSRQSRRRSRPCVIVAGSVVRGDADSVGRLASKRRDRVRRLGRPDRGPTGEIDLVAGNPDVVGRAPPCERHTRRRRAREPEAPRPRRTVIVSAASAAPASRSAAVTALSDAGGGRGSITTPASRAEMPTRKLEERWDFEYFGRCGTFGVDMAAHLRVTDSALAEPRRTEVKQFSSKKSTAGRVG